jgi:hypothetical protein
VTIGPSLKKKINSIETFIDRVLVKKSDYGLFPEPTDAQDTVNILVDALLGPNTILTNDSLPARHTNSYAVDQILWKYSRYYRRRIRQIRRRVKRERKDHD